MIKFFGLIFAISVFYYFTVPVCDSADKVELHGQQLEEIKASVNEIKSSIFAPGLYLGCTLSSDTGVTYHYIIPTHFQLGDSEHVFVILPGTRFILDVQK